jgi:hypothetical protein
MDNYSMNTPLQAEESVWYREFYVWLVIFLPLCAVAASFATLYIAAKNAPDMAVSDYGSIEAISSEQAGRDRRAAELGLVADISFSDGADKALVKVYLRGNDLAELPPLLKLRIVHSTVASLDDETLLAADSSGIYGGSIGLPEGAFDLHLEDQGRSWRLSARATGDVGELEIRPYALSAADAGTP